MYQVTTLPKVANHLLALLARGTQLLPTLLSLGQCVWSTPFFTFPCLTQVTHNMVS